MNETLEALAHDLELRLPKPWRALYVAMTPPANPYISILKIGHARQGKTTITLKDSTLTLQSPRINKYYTTHFNYELNDPTSLDKLDQDLREIGVPLSPAEQYLYDQI